MYFLGLGLIFLAMWYLGMDPVASWPWYIIFAPFAAAVAWWSWADSSGYTKRKAMQRMEDKRIARINKHKETIGTLSAKDKKKRR